MNQLLKEAVIFLLKQEIEFLENTPYESQSDEDKGKRRRAIEETDKLLEKLENE